MYEERYAEVSLAQIHEQLLKEDGEAKLLWESSSEFIKRIKLSIEAVFQN